jgi:hypothetical protein
MHTHYRVACPGYFFAFVALLAVAPLSSARAQPGQEEKPENLKVLPEDISNQDLRRIMFGFAQALGVRCHHCHVGEEGQPLSTYDFASDDKDTKETARTMMRMVQAINGEYLADLPTTHEAMQVACITCHHGVTHPQQLENVLADYLPEHGVDSTLAYYDRLRGQYFGGSSYDFQEPTLIRLAQELINQEKAQDALAFLDLNAGLFPESSETFALQGEAYLLLDDHAAAVASLEKALALNPNNRRLQERLEDVKNQ